MNIDPASIDVASRYKLLIGAVVPRPIAFVSSCSPTGALNLAPFSFFNAVSSTPMCVMFGPANNSDGSEKDTLRNAALPAEGGTGEFVVNLAVESYIRNVAVAAEPLPADESEFDLVKLTPAPSTVVAPPRVEASPVAFECRTMQVIRLQPGSPAGGNLVLGEVVHIHVRDDLINERMHIDPERLAAVGRMGGRSYCTTRQRFDLPVGRSAFDEPQPDAVR